MVTPLAPQQLAGILPRQAVRMVQDALQAAGCPDADYDARELLRIAAGKDPRLLFDPLTRPQAECLAELAAQRMQRVPLQYLAGEWDFLGLTFKVGPGVLCPAQTARWCAKLPLSCCSRWENLSPGCWTCAPELAAWALASAILCQVPA